MKARPSFAALIVLAVVAGQSPLLLGAVIGEPKKPYTDRPNDTPREHVQEIGEGRQAYTIEFRGAVDGTMTRMPIGYAAFQQGWQPNRSVVIENRGQSDVHNPRIVVNGRRAWWTLADLVAEATRGYTTPADKARAIWEFQRRHRFHATTWDAECVDAVKALNVYGYTLCGNEATIINDLWKAAGLTTRRGHPVGHCVTEVFYDGEFHLLDSDEHVICLRRDNRTIASEAEIVGDHDLVKRTHTYGINQSDSRDTDEFSASLYGYEGERKGDWGTNTSHVMNLVLRPGESIEFRWDHVGKQYTAGESPMAGQPLRDGLGDLLSGWGPTAYDNLRNGKLRYQPDLARPEASRGVEAIENAVFDPAAASIRPTAPQRPSTITWRFECPYVFVGGKARAAVTLGAGASAEWRFSADQKQWQPLAAADEKTSGNLVADLDRVLSPRRRPMYRFWLQLVVRGEGSIVKPVFENDIQTSALSLPELEKGTNQIVYTDADPTRQVRITHRWLERTTWHAPQAPAEAIAPLHDATVQGSRVAFQWKPAVDPDGDAIVDYHFELSEHADMRWPLSPNFEKLISRTASRGKARWTVPSAGLLNPQTTYYWRVRACDAKGVWGPWSPVFRFRLQAPGVPLDLRLASTGEPGWTLHWRANPEGQTPVAYKVYGSDERGFSASDTEYSVVRGKGFVRSIEEYTNKSDKSPDAGRVKTPASLITRVAGTSLHVVGPDLTQPNVNKAFYRVVAVDAAGNESGPSAYIEVTRPLLVNRPGREAQVGKPYRYEPHVIRSVGDLRCRPSKASSYNAAFWDREELTFSASSMPDGLSMDSTTGVITGTPSKSGVFEVGFKVADQAGKSCAHTYSLNVAP